MGSTSSAEYFARLAVFCFARHFRPEEVMERASAVMVGLDSERTMDDLVREVETSVPPSMIYEQWEFRFATALHAKAARLGGVRGEALLCCAGYDDVSLDSIAADAADAVEEARQALYGD